MAERTALVVDDEPDLRLIASMSLAIVGNWRVVEAGSGAEALVLARTGRPDVILLDVMMPELDGLATFALLRQDPVCADVPVIFMTAKVQAHEVARYRGVGAAGVILKPFDPMRLADRVHEILTSGSR
jgi:CheY-like chemotaxis protein